MGSCVFQPECLGWDFFWLLGNNMAILGVVLIIVGLSAGVQSFRVQGTLYEILKAGRNPDSLTSTLWTQRLISVFCLGAGLYILL